jgi:hypothetical protein
MNKDKRKDVKMETRRLKYVPYSCESWHNSTAGSETILSSGGMLRAAADVLFIGQTNKTHTGTTVRRRCTTAYEIFIVTNSEANDIVFCCIQSTAMLLK